MKKKFLKPTLEIIDMKDVGDILLASDSWAKDKDIWPTEFIDLE